MEKKEFKFMVEQIRNFITHCIGFQPDDITGGEFSNRFVWKTNNSEFEVVAFYGCSLKTDQDFFEYYLTIDEQRIDGSYYFGNRLTCEDENEITRIIQPFKKSIVNKNTLGITTNVERSTYSKRYYIIQAFKDCNWQDVLFSSGDIFTAEKKARHFRNKNDCETRVIEVKENVSYSYDYSLVTEYSKNDKIENY